MKETSRDPYAVREFALKYCSGDLEFEPGERFRYNNSGYFILGLNPGNRNAADKLSELKKP